MRIVHLKRGLPRNWSRHPAARGVVGEFDIRLRRHSRLRAKVMVFARVADLRAFWSAALGKSGLGRGVRGVVSPLMRTTINIRKGVQQPEYIEADPNYFCAIGLTHRHLTMEIISHESVHAAFSYQRRVKRSPWAKLHDFDEEHVAYPAGVIAAAINRWLHKHDLYD